MAQLHGKWIRKGNYQQETLIIVCSYEMTGRFSFLVSYVQNQG